MTRVYKFGGASVRDAAAVGNITDILNQETTIKGLLVVVSAMGKTTNKLEEIAELAFAKRDHRTLVRDLEDFHLGIASDLNINPGAAVQPLLDELRRTVSHPDSDWLHFLDKVRSFGELLSTRIIHQFLEPKFKVKWLDARDYVVTSPDHDEALPDWEQTRSRIVKLKRDLSKGMVLTQGYIGQSSEGQTTTLGREGSDYSAAIFASCLSAASVTAWKDVPGILNADPKLMNDTVRFPRLSYEEVTEMTYYGANVIHPHTLVALASANIPLYVRSFVAPELEGTTIRDHMESAKLPTFVFKFRQLVVTLRVKDSTFMDESSLMLIFSELSRLRVKLNLMQNSALTFTICFDENDEKLHALREALAGSFFITFNTGLHLATVKNYTEDALRKLPPARELILEQKSRSVYQRLYHP